jgi:hypothetical protein
MHPEIQEEIQLALYYLNNRHRLKMQDMPQYLKALELARKYDLEESNGIWYLPAEPVDEAC